MKWQFAEVKGCLPVCVLICFSHVRVFMTLWTVAQQVPLSMGFSRQEYWSGLPRPPPGDLPHSEVEPTVLMSPALAGSLPLAPSGRDTYSVESLEGEI